MRITPAFVLATIVRDAAIMEAEVEEEFENSTFKTLVVFFEPEKRETKFIPLDLDDPDRFMVQVEHALDNHWEPIATELVRDDEAFDCINLTFFSPHQTIEDEAIVAGLFEAGTVFYASHSKKKQAL